MRACLTAVLILLVMFSPARIPAGTTQRRGAATPKMGDRAPSYEKGREAPFRGSRLRPSI